MITIKAQEHIERMLKEMKSEDLFFPVHINQIRRYLWMAHGMGFEEGRKYRSNCKAVHQLDKYGTPIEKYDSAAEAERITGISATKITAVCKGKAVTAGTYLWKYVKLID